jgi:DNA-binding transcriptional regulator YdaS (Cro superfamily)
VDLETFIKSERGNASRLAASIGVSLSYLSQLKDKDKTISPKRCVQIEEATDRQVTRQDLRPEDWADIWPELKTLTEQAA